MRILQNLYSLFFIAIGESGAECRGIEVQGTCAHTSATMNTRGRLLHPRGFLREGKDSTRCFQYRFSECGKTRAHHRTAGYQRGVCMMIFGTGGSCSWVQDETNAVDTLQGIRIEYNCNEDTSYVIELDGKISSEETSFRVWKIN